MEEVKAQAKRALDEGQSVVFVLDIVIIALYSLVPLAVSAEVYVMFQKLKLARHQLSANRRSAVELQALAGVAAL